MKTTTKLLVLVLVVILCFGSLVACGGGDETTTTTTASGTTAGTGTSSSSTIGDGPLPPTPIDWEKFSGSMCTFYYKSNWGETTLWINQDAVGVNQADIATAARIDFFQDKTGITLKGITSGDMNYYTVLQPILAANDPADIPDILFVSGSDVGNLLFNGELVELNHPDTPNMNFDHDCWHENVNNNLSILGAYFAVSGYYDTSNFMRSAAMFFDRDALETINNATIDFAAYPELAGYVGEDSLYEWAANGEWTWDKAVALAKLFAGPDGTFNGDIPAKNGIQYVPTDAIMLMSSVDLQPFKNDEFGVPTLDLDSVAQEKLNYLHDYITYDAGSKYANYIGSVWDASADPNRPDLFGTNHTALFNVQLTNKLVNYAKLSTDAVTFRYGILPVPKYNEQQENYFSMAGQWYTNLACIPNKCTDIDFSTFVLQHFTEMGKEKFHPNIKTVFEAVIEDGLSGRYAASTDNAENDKAMLQIIMDSVDAWLWDYYAGQFKGAEHNQGTLHLWLNTQATPNWQTINDATGPVIRESMYQMLVKIGFAEAA